MPIQSLYSVVSNRSFVQGHETTLQWHVHHECDKGIYSSINTYLHYIRSLCYRYRINGHSKHVDGELLHFHNCISGDKNNCQ